MGDAVKTEVGLCSSRQTMKGGKKHAVMTELGLCRSRQTMKGEGKVARCNDGSGVNVARGIR